MIKQAAAAPRPCRAKPQLPHPSPFPGALSGPAGFLFPQTASKIGCFGAFADRKFIRMAAKLRPAGRQTTPPGRADELPARKAPKQRNFFTGLREKTSGRPGQCPREGRGMRQLRFGPAWTGCGGGLFYPKTYTMKKRQRRILFGKARIFL